jgi:exopolyphosphatase/guanosine-5'-triphosphate,3'-diphosphate pyrophosphatase
MTRFAAIDVGTNSVKMTIAVVEDAEHIDTITRQRYVSQLGRDHGEDGSLDQDAMERTIGDLIKFNDLSASLEVDQVRAVATQVVRDAPNRDVFIEQVHACTGLELEVLEGEEEAGLSWLAICHEHEVGEGASVLLDVGGGSMECLHAHGERIKQVVSLPLGALRLTQAFELADTIDSNRWGSLVAHIKSELATGLSRPNDPAYAWGVGGTLKSLVSLDRIGMGLRQKEEMVSPGGDWAFTGLGVDRIEAIVAELCSMSLAERIDATGLEPERASIIPAGGVVALETLKYLGADRGCCVTRQCLRDGLLLRMAGLRGDS